MNLNDLFYENIFTFKKTTRIRLFSSVTSTCRKPCVCHTHTEKQALYNRSVKSPCSKSDEGLREGGTGAGWASVRREKLQKTLGNKMTPEFIRFSSQLRSRVETELYHFP